MLYGIINVFIIMGMWCILLAVGKSVLSRKMESPLKYAFGAMTQQGILSHFWYLWMLVIMYLIVPILLYLRKKGMIAWTNLVLLLLCVVMSSNTLLLGKNGVESNIPQFLRIWTHVAYFWCGGIVYRLLKDTRQRKKIKDVLKSHQLIFTLGISAFVISMAILQYKVLGLIIGLHSPEYLFSNPIIICYNVFIFLILVVLFQRKRKEYVFGIIVRLSKDGFGVYVLHMFIIIILTKVAPGMNWLLRFITVTIISFITSDTIRKIPVIRKLIQF